MRARMRLSSRGGGLLCVLKFFFCGCVGRKGGKERSFRCRYTMASTGMFLLHALSCTVTTTSYGLEEVALYAGMGLAGCACSCVCWDGVGTKGAVMMFVVL